MRFKKVIFGFLFGLFGTACQPDSHLSDWMRDNGKIKVLSTTAQIGDLVSQVGGERVDSLVLIQGNLDPHSYEIVKGDAEKLGKADLIFYNGLGLEHGASLSSLLRNSPKAIPIGEKIRLSHSDQMIWREGVVDPHIWMDISLWKEGIDPIVSVLSQLDPEGALLYQEQGKKLSVKMDEMHRDIQALLRTVPSEKRYLVTSHDAFQYFARSYLAEPREENWAERVNAPEGLAPEGQLKARELQKIIDVLKKRRIAVLFPESNVSRDSIQKIATAGKEFGLNVQICSEPLYGDAMNHLTYLEMMHENANTIAKYLLCNQP